MNTRGDYIFIIGNVLLTIGFAFIFAIFIPGSGISLSIITAIVVSIYLLLLQLYFFNKKMHSTAYDKVINIIKIDNSFHHDNNWSYQTLARIASINGNNNRSDPIYMTLVEKNIGDGIKKAEELLQSGCKIDCPGLSGEFTRQKWLYKFVSCSQNYVKAVTSFDTDYWENFWENKWADKYIQTNVNVAKKGVSIHRIFILPNKVLLGKDDELCAKIAKIINSMLNLHQNLNVSCVAIEEVDNVDDFEQKNFLIVDDKYSSVSDKFSENHDGHISIGINDEIHSLNNLFEMLEHISKPAKTFKFVARFS